MSMMLPDGRSGYPELSTEVSRRRIALSAPFDPMRSDDALIRRFLNTSPAVPRGSQEVSCCRDSLAAPLQWRDFAPGLSDDSRLHTALTPMPGPPPARWRRHIKYIITLI